MPVQHRARPPLIAASWRPAVATAVIVALTGLVALGIALRDDHDGTRFDDAVLTWLLSHVGAVAQQALLVLAEPALVLVLLAVIAVLAALLRRWDVLVLAVVGPAAALILTEIVLKPSVNRTVGLVVDLPTGPGPAGAAFPSGHETGLASLTTVLLILLARAPVSRRVRAVSVAALVLWTVGGALGLVRSLYHFATDTVGAICVSVVCVAGVALLVDALAAQLKPRQLTPRS